MATWKITWRMFSSKTVMNKGFSEKFRPLLPTYSTFFSRSFTKLSWQSSPFNIMDLDMKKYDALQVELMKEQCILIDNEDNVIGSTSKRSCHLLENINSGMLHRAFSVFLFNNNGELLLQQRAMSKITYPGHFTNTCCSHPLYFPAELDEDNHLGVRRAAQRKLHHELGITPNEIPLDAIKFITRIRYKSDNFPYDGVWGESEIDHVLFIKQDVNVIANPNEVLSYEYIGRNKLQSLLNSEENKTVLLTPWFKLIVKNFLHEWWDNLDHMEVCYEHEKIHIL